MTTDTSTLYKLLEQMQVKTRWFDLGRRIGKLKREQIQQFEDGIAPYPHPYLRQAWLGLVFWPEQDKKKEQVQIWCLRLPLDEQGKLDLGARDDFLKQLLFSLGSNIEAAQAGKRLNAVLENNPYELKLPPEKQASLHAKISLELKQPASSHYQNSLGYLQNQDWPQWQAVGVQGLADIASRWQQHTALLCQALPHLPEQVLVPLAQCLEHEKIGEELSHALLARLKLSNEAKLMANLIRGLSASRQPQPLQQALRYCLSHPEIVQLELLAAISSRCAETALEPEFALVFLEHLAAAGQGVFNGLLAEMLFQPNLRLALMAAFRLPQRSEVLSQAIAQLLTPSELNPTTG